MVIRLRARHFKDVSYRNHCDCALARAIKDALNQYNIPFNHVHEGVDDVTIYSPAIGGNYNIPFNYKHKHYGLRRFLIDKLKAFILSYGNLVVRKITIPGLPPQELSTKTPLEVVDELERERQLWKYDPNHY